MIQISSTDAFRLNVAGSDAEKGCVLPRGLLLLSSVLHTHTRTSTATLVRTVP